MAECVVIKRIVDIVAIVNDLWEGISFVSNRMNYLIWCVSSIIVIVSVVVNTPIIDGIATLDPLKSVIEKFIKFVSLQVVPFSDPIRNFPLQSGVVVQDSVGMGGRIGK